MRYLELQEHEKQTIQKIMESGIITRYIDIFETLEKYNIEPFEKNQINIRLVNF